MMCTCDEEIGNKYFSHQLDEGVELDTQIRVPVTAGFVPNICETCRGLPAIPYPAAAVVGRTSNVRRYYWREIAFETMKRFDAWLLTNDHAEYSAEAVVARKRIEKEVVADIQQLRYSPTFAASVCRCFTLERGRAERQLSAFLNKAEGRA